MISGLKGKYFGGLLYCLPCCLAVLSLSGQPTPSDVHGWQNGDFRKDSVFGAGISRAYAELLKGRKPGKVIVALIDDGVDTAHEDLAGHIWTNTREIPGNGIDDDHNGYIDDMHGWNFLGGPDGRYIDGESYESYREYFRLREDSLRGGRRGTDAYAAAVTAQFLKDSLREVKTVVMLDQMLPQVARTDSLLRAAFQRDSMSAKDFEQVTSGDSAVVAARQMALSYYKKYGISRDMPLVRFLEEGRLYLKSERNKLNGLSADPNALRRDIVGDNFNDIDDRQYGNNDVSAGTPAHGTHVAGIIAAGRNNGIGMDGITERVQIMSLRAVPDGDERDKDVALAIRYAVDNGARIINMSFGKYFSPGKKWVDDAVRYAAVHGVLIVHAAGNESVDIDSVIQYPNPYLLSGEDCRSSFITVGSNGAGPDSLLPARSTNYGQRVDLFAPGVKIYSTVSGNRYETYSGTSMASPIVSGIAALLLEYYPRLTARQLREILMASVYRPDRRRVRLAVAGKYVDFGTLCASGGVVNAYNALALAARMYPAGERTRIRKKALR